MSARGNYYKIGAFILSALTIVVVAIVVLSGGKWFEQTLRWETYFDESVQGLAIGAPIKYRGVKIGTVQDIDFVDNAYGSDISKEDRLRYGRYVVVTGSTTPIIPGLTEEERKAERASKIGTGLRIRLASQGVTGIVHLEADYLDPIAYPAMNVPWTPRSEYVPSAPSTVTVVGTVLHNIARGLEKADIREVARNLDMLLLDVAKLVKGANLPQLTRQAGQMVAEVQATAQEIRRLVESPEIDTIITGAATTVSETNPLIANLSQASKQVRIATDKFPHALSRLEQVMQQIDRLVSNNSQDMNEIVENLRVVSENLRELTNNAKRYPAQVFFGDPPPAAGSTRP